MSATTAPASASPTGPVEFEALRLEDFEQPEFRGGFVVERSASVDDPPSTDHVILEALRHDVEVIRSRYPLWSFRIGGDAARRSYWLDARPPRRPVDVPFDTLSSAVVGATVGALVGALLAAYMMPSTSNAGTRGKDG